MSFQRALSRTLLYEGGYANDPADPGGETYEGVSRKNNPDWQGWTVIDSLRGTADFPSSLDDDPQLPILVEQLYRDFYWDPIRADDLPDAIAEKVFDVAVNLGVPRAVKMLQGCLAVIQDGVVGPKTIAAAIERPDGDLLECIRDEQRAYYKRLVERNPTLHKFLRGWLRRAAA